MAFVDVVVEEGFLGKMGLSRSTGQIRRGRRCWISTATERLWKWGMEFAGSCNEEDEE